MLTVVGTWKLGHLHRALIHGPKKQTPGGRTEFSSEGLKSYYQSKMQEVKYGGLLTNISLQRQKSAARFMRYRRGCQTYGSLWIWSIEFNQRHTWNVDKHFHMSRTVHEELEILRLAWLDAHFVTCLSSTTISEQQQRRQLRQGSTMLQRLKVSPQVRIASPIDTQSLCIDQPFNDRPGSLDFVLSTSSWDPGSQ